jgi:hypothetical protein
MKLPYRLRIRPQRKIFVDAKHHSWDSTIDVLDASGSRIEKFFLMAAAMDDDIQNPESSGATALEEIRRIEAGEVDTISSDGNG